MVSSHRVLTLGVWPEASGWVLCIRCVRCCCCCGIQSLDYTLAEEVLSRHHAVSVASQGPIDLQLMESQIHKFAPAIVLHYPLYFYSLSLAIYYYFFGICFILCALSLWKMVLFNFFLK